MDLHWNHDAINTPYLLILKNPKKTRVNANFFLDCRELAFAFTSRLYYTRFIQNLGYPFVPHIYPQISIISIISIKKMHAHLATHENLRIILISIYIYINIYRY